MSDFSVSRRVTQLREFMQKGAAVLEHSHIESSDMVEMTFSCYAGLREREDR
jgi:hypothetical protein